MDIPYAEPILIDYHELPVGLLAQLLYKPRYDLYLGGGILTPEPEHHDARRPVQQGQEAEVLIASYDDTVFLLCLTDDELVLGPSLLISYEEDIYPSGPQDIARPLAYVLI